jgi:hypothetical protein
MAGKKQSKLLLRVSDFGIDGHCRKHVMTLLLSISNQAQSASPRSRRKRSRAKHH